MENEAKVGKYIDRSSLVVPIQVELTDDLVIRVQKEILDEVRQGRLKGVVIDLSGVNIIDIFLATAIFNTAKMASLLGAKTVVTGLRSGVVAALTDLDFDPGNVPTAQSISDGLQLLVPPEVPEKEEIEDDEIHGEVDPGD